MSAEAEGSELAAGFRLDHRLGEQPLGDLAAIIEQATGIDVAVLEADPDEHGMAVRDPARETVFIGVARTRNPMRQRSTLAHELGQVLSGDWTDRGDGSWSDRSPAEIRADSFARHLLAPVDGLRGFLGARRSASLPVLSMVTLSSWMIMSALLHPAVGSAAC